MWTQFQDGRYTAVGLTSPELSYTVAVLEFLGVMHIWSCVWGVYAHAGMPMGLPELTDKLQKWCLQGSGS